MLRQHRHSVLLKACRNFLESTLYKIGFTVELRKYKTPAIEDKTMLINENQLCLLAYHRGGSRISGKRVQMYKGVGVRFAYFISFFLNIP